LRARSFTLDGEAVVCGPDGVAIFDALHHRGTVTEAVLYAFDLLELDGEDLRGLPLSDRKKRLTRLLGGRRLGIVLSDHTPNRAHSSGRRACSNEQLDVDETGLGDKKSEAGVDFRRAPFGDNDGIHLFDKAELPRRFCAGVQPVQWLGLRVGIHALMPG
jgi:hypothetical protein